MQISSGLANTIKMAASWALAAAVGAGSFIYQEPLRDALGLRFEADALSETASASDARSQPRPRARAEAPGSDDRPARRPGSFSVELSRQSDGHFHADAYINGRRIQVLVDTGATLVAMSYEDAKAAGISVGAADFKYFSETANGRARFAGVMLDEVRIGDVLVRNVRASVAEPGRLQTTLLGMSFLGQLRMSMQSGYLTLEQ